MSVHCYKGSFWHVHPQCYSCVWTCGIEKQNWVRQHDGWTPTRVPDSFDLKLPWTSGLFVHLHLVLHRKRYSWRSLTDINDPRSYSGGYQSQCIPIFVSFSGIDSARRVSHHKYGSACGLVLQAVDPFGLYR